jgi:hypothetical protein
VTTAIEIFSGDRAKEKQPVDCATSMVNARALKWTMSYHNKANVSRSSEHPGLQYLTDLPNDGNHTPERSNNEGPMYVHRSRGS